MALLDGKQLRNTSVTLNKISGTGSLVMQTGAVFQIPTANINVATDVVNKEYADSIASGLGLKQSVITATTATSSIPAYVAAGSGIGKTLTGATYGAIGSVGGYSGLTAGDRLLVKNEGIAATYSSTHNGIYVVTNVGSVVSNYVLTRASDFDGSPTNEVRIGSYTFVQSGDEAGHGFVCLSVATSSGSISVDIDPINFSQFSDTGAISAGDGLIQTGQVFDVDLAANSGLTFSATKLSVDSNIAGNGLSWTSGVISVNATNGLTIISDNLQINPSAAGAGLTFSAGVFNIGAGSGITVNADTIQADYAAQSAAQAGAGLTSSGNVLDVQTTNGLSIINDSVGLGGSLTQNTQITNTSNIFTMSSTNNIYFDTNDGFGGAETRLRVYDVSNNVTTTTITAGSLINRSANTGSSTEANVTTTTTDLKMEVKPDAITSNTIKLYTTGQTIGDGSTNNAMVIDDQIYGKGLVYTGDYTGMFTTHSLVTKGWVNSQLSSLGDITAVQAGNGLNGGGTQGAVTLSLNFGTVSNALAGAGLTAVGSLLNVVGGNGITVNADDIQVNYTQVVQAIAGVGLTSSGATIQLNTGSLAGSGLTGNAGLLDVNVSNGLQILNDTVVLGGTLSIPTQIVNGANAFTMSSNNSTINFNKFSGSATFSVGIDSVKSVIETRTANEFIQVKTTDTYASMRVGTDADSATTGDWIKILNANSVITGGDASTNNRMIIKDSNNSKGLVYDNDYSANFTNNSLVTKSWVLGQISAGDITDVVAGAGLTGGATMGVATLNIGAGNGITVNTDDIAVNYTQVAQSLASSGLTASGGTIVVNAAAVALMLGGAGLTANGGMLDIGAGNGITVNADSISVNHSQVAVAMSGAGLTANGNVFDVGAGNGITVNADTVAINYTQAAQALAGTGLTSSGGTITANFAGISQVLGGAGLTANGNVLDVGAGAGITVNADTVAVDYSGVATQLAGAGLAPNGTTIDVGAGTGITVNANTIQVDAGAIAGTGLTGSGSTISLAVAPVYTQRNLTPSVTSNFDGQTTGLSISSTPSDNAEVQIFVNGQLQLLGNGASASVDCFFGTPAAPKSIAAIAATDTLYWNSVTAGFTLAATDRVDIIYSV